MKSKNNNDEHKEVKSQHQHVNESVIKKENLIRRLVSMNIQQTFIQYVIGTVTLCS